MGKVQDEIQALRHSTSGEEPVAARLPVFGIPPFIRHALVSVPFGVAHSGRPSKQASRLRSQLCMSCRRPTCGERERLSEGRICVRRNESAGGGRDALSRDARKGGMAFGAHEPPRTRRRPRPCRANPHCGGAPTNAALKGGFPESVSSRSTAGNSRRLAT